MRLLRNSSWLAGWWLAFWLPCQEDHWSASAKPIMFVRAICRVCQHETLISDKLPVKCEQCKSDFFRYQTFSKDTIARFDRAFLKLLGISAV